MASRHYVIETRDVSCFVSTLLAGTLLLVLAPFVIGSVGRANPNFNGGHLVAGALMLAFGGGLFVTAWVEGYAALRRGRQALGPSLEEWIRFKYPFASLPDEARKFERVAIDPAKIFGGDPSRRTAGDGNDLRRALLDRPRDRTVPTRSEPDWTQARAH